MDDKERYELECKIKKEVIDIRREQKELDYRVDNLLDDVTKLVVNGAEQIQKKKGEKENG